MLQGIDFPICRSFTNPFHAGILHRSLSADALGNGLGDDGLLQFFVLLDGFLGLLKDGIYLGTFGIKEVGDATLL